MGQTVNMMRPGHSRLRTVPEEAILRLHEASLQILERTGVEFVSDEACALLADAGAQAIGERRVRIPRAMVERALASTPHSIQIYDRSGNPAMLLEGYNSYYGTGSDTLNTIDPYGGRRPSVKADVGRAAKLVDWLPNFDFAMNMGIASDVDPATSDVHHFQEMVTHTAKPLIFTSWGLANIKRIYEMCLAVRGSERGLREKPFVILYAEPNSPLRHIPEVVDKILFCADHLVPVIYPGSPVMGASAPITEAGAIAIGNAEFLSGLVLAQARNPGTPFIYGGQVCMMDMRTTVVPYAAPEFFTSYVALRELASYYRLPVFGNGGCSDSKTFDQQAAAEADWTLTVASITGNNIIHDVGYIESGSTACYELMVLCDELISKIRHFLKGIVVDDETLALGLIDEIGPGGAFLAEEHTVRHLRKQWYPRWSDRRRFDEWQESGAVALGKRLNEQVRWILENHVPAPLAPEVEREIARTLRTLSV